MQSHSTIQPLYAAIDVGKNVHCYAACAGRETWATIAAAPRSWGGKPLDAVWVVCARRALCCIKE